MNNTDTFKILTLDGGGTRGIYTAQLLALVEQEFDIRIKDSFDLIAGTSTGAIIAGAIVSEIPMDEIVGLFESEAPDIFRKRWYRNLLFSSKYSEDVLAQVIAKHIPAKPLSEILTPLIITSSEITTSELHIFRSNYATELNVRTNILTVMCVYEMLLLHHVPPQHFFRLKTSIICFMQMVVYGQIILRLRHILKH